MGSGEGVLLLRAAKCRVCITLALRRTVLILQGEDDSANAMICSHRS